MTHNSNQTIIVTLGHLLRETNVSNLDELDQVVQAKQNEFKMRFISLKYPQRTSQEY